jgi:predicted MPP superfamily phosphohydrolase
MKFTNILHITDLHFGPSPNLTVKPNVLMSEELTSKLFVNDWKNRFIIDVKQSLSQYKINLIACTGDITLGKNKEGLQLGIEYLSKLAKELDVSPDNVLVCPGNHDISRLNVTTDSKLDEFCNECKSKNFKYAEQDQPAIVNVNNINIIALNSCLGSSEHALLGIPKNLIKLNVDQITNLENKYKKAKILESIPDGYVFQFESMDIPAIGEIQRQKLVDILSTMNGNCIVLLMHHNLIPTQIPILRPYALPLDSGILITQLMKNNRYVIVLHGHTHDKSGINLYPQQFDDGVDHGGFIASIGNVGISGNKNDSATFIQIITSDTNEFIRANVYSITRNGTVYEKRFEYSLRERSIKLPQIMWKMDKVPINVSMYFKEFAKAVKEPASESLALDLLRLDELTVKINGKEGHLIDNWRISRIL